MEIEYLAAFNLLVAALIIKVALAPSNIARKAVGPVLLAFIIINAVALGAGVAA
jgi:hypothetical protein